MPAFRAKHGKLRVGVDESGDEDGGCRDGAFERAVSRVRRWGWMRCLCRRFVLRQVVGSSRNRLVLAGAGHFFHTSERGVESLR